MTRLFLRDFVRAGVCVSGVQAFCREHNLDFRNFARNGATPQELENVPKTAFLDCAIEAAEAREKEEEGA